MVIYAGNERGDIVATRLSPSELATLCGEAQGPVPCQRRPNHNPYRHVRVKLTPQNANISLRAAFRAQRQETAGKQEMEVAGGCDASRFVMSEANICASGIITSTACIVENWRHVLWLRYFRQGFHSPRRNLTAFVSPTRFDDRLTRDGVTIDGDTYNFAVPSSNFHTAWRAHSAAVSSVSWIDSPASLLSTSADGLAKIWTPDGNTLLGQVGVTLYR